MALKLARLLSMRSAGAAAAQGVGDHIDPALERILAERWYAECHVVTSRSTNPTPLPAGADFSGDRQGSDQGRARVDNVSEDEVGRTLLLHCGSLIQSC